MNAEKNETNQRHIRDIEGVLEGTFIGAQRGIEIIGNFFTSYTSYELKTAGDKIKVCVPEITDIVRKIHTVKTGDNIKIERKDNSVHIRISGLSDYRSIRNFWRKKQRLEIRHEYKYPLEK